MPSGCAGSARPQWPQMPQTRPAVVQPPHAHAQSHNSRLLSPPPNHTTANTHHGPCTHLHELQRLTVADRPGGVAAACGHAQGHHLARLPQQAAGDLGVARGGGRGTSGADVVGAALAAARPRSAGQRADRRAVHKQANLLRCNTPLPAARLPTISSTRYAILSYSCLRGRCRKKHLRPGSARRLRYAQGNGESQGGFTSGVLAAI